MSGLVIVVVLFFLWQGVQLTLLLPRTRAVWRLLQQQPDTTLHLTGLVFLALAAAAALFA